MTNLFRFSFLLLYIIFNTINDIQAVPKGYLLGITFEFGTEANKVYKIDPLTGEFTIFTMLNNYKPYDVTYDYVHKIFYIFGSEAVINQESSASVLLINPFNGTKHYRTIVTEDYAELFGLRVDSSTGKLYSIQMSSALENPVSIVEIDRTNFIAKRWMNITKVDGISSDPIAVFYNSTTHQSFVSVASGLKNILVGVGLMKAKIISEITASDIPSYLCYDNKTKALYGMQRFIQKRGCYLVRFNPYNGTTDILSEEFHGYEPSGGACYDGYYFTMIILNVQTQKIVTFDLNNGGKVVANKLGEVYLSSLAFIPT